MEDLSTPQFDSIQPQFCINSKLRRLYKIADGIYQRELSEFGLKGSMLPILFEIGKNPGVSQKQIAEYLVLDQSTVSRDVRKMESKGWVVLITSEEDSRIAEITLTKKGALFLEEIVPVWKDIHHRVIEHLGVYNTQNIDALINCMTHLKI